MQPTLYRIIDTRDRTTAEALGNDVRRHFQQFVPYFHQSTLSIQVALPIPEDRRVLGVGDRHEPPTLHELRDEPAVLLLGTWGDEDLLDSAQQVAESIMDDARAEKVA